MLSLPLICLCDRGYEKPRSDTLISVPARPVRIVGGVKMQEYLLWIKIHAHICQIISVQWAGVTAGVVPYLLKDICLACLRTLRPGARG